MHTLGSTAELVLKILFDVYDYIYYKEPYNVDCNKILFKESEHIGVDYRVKKKPANIRNGKI